MSKAKVLVVEDEVIVGMALRMKLGAWGYDVIGVEGTGLGAIEAFDRGKPDIAILDIFLSGSLDGIAVGRHIKSAGSTPFIFVTASQDKETADRARGLDPAAILPKPCQESLLRSTLELLSSRCPRLG